jgi:hypothetical protein
MLSRVATWGDLLRRAAEIGFRALTTAQKETKRRPARSAGRTHPTPADVTPRRGGARTAPAGDRARRVAYAPDLDGSADPGEIVWTWVPYEEADGRGKDRPVLVVGREGRDLVGLMLSSQDEHADDRNWVGIGTGEWDRQGRASFVRLDRVIEVGEHDIRREGAILDQRRFDRVADELRARFGWT